MQQSVSLDLKVIPTLEIQPESLCCAEVPGEPKRCIGSDAPLPMHDLVDASRRHTDRQSELVLGDAQRLKVLHQEDFPWVDGWQG